VAGRRLDLTLADEEAFASAGMQLGRRVLHADRTQLMIGVATDGSAAHVRGLLDELDPDRSAVARFSVEGGTLDDVFLALTGHKAAESKMEPANA
jgi:ABC-2 type transport system ATP-binding protein